MSIFDPLRTLPLTAYHKGMAPEWLVYLVLLVSMLAGFLVKVEAGRRLDARGDGFLAMQSKSGALGCAALVGVWGLYFALGHIIRWLSH